MSEWRVKRRGRGWGVQERRGWFWRWWGPHGDRSWIAKDSGIALWFANLCERVDARDALARENGGAK